jgi:hypothetical protein
MNVDPNYVVHGRGQLLTERSGGGGADTPLYMSYILVRVLHCRLILCLLVSRRCWRCNRTSIIVKFWLTLVVFPLTLGGFSTLNVVSHLRFDFSAFVDYSPSFITIESGNTMDSNAQTPPRWREATRVLAARGRGRPCFDVGRVAGWVLDGCDLLVSFIVSPSVSRATWKSSIRWL